MKVKLTDRFCPNTKSGMRMDYFDEVTTTSGATIEDAAQHLCRSGTVDEVRRKAEEIGLRRGLPPGCGREGSAAIDFRRGFWRVSVVADGHSGCAAWPKLKDQPRQRILPAIHWRMNERWFLFPLPPADPAPLCSESASHFSRLWTCASGAAANALPASNGIFPAKQSRMNALWVRPLGPGPDALCAASASQAL